MKILHLEDSIIHLTTVGQILAERPEWQLTQVSTMAEAFASYERERPDIVICDARVEHDDDGVDWAEHLHRRGQFVIINSAYAHNQRDGIVFVPKQSMRDELIPALERLVQVAVALHRTGQPGQAAVVVS